MKKILIIILAGVLLHPLPTKAQFGQDAAALIGFLTPYLGALEALSEAAMADVCTGGNPRPCSKELVWKVYKTAFNGK